MMRLAHVGNYKPESTNGVNQAVAGYTKYLSARGFDIELWNFTPEVCAVEERSVEGLKIFDLPRHRARWWRLVHMPTKTRHFLEKRSSEVDLVHTHSVFIPENLWVSHLGTPYVVTPHGGYRPQVIGGRNRFLKRAWLSLWEKSYLDRARAVHAVSPIEADELRDLGVRAPVVNIPKGIDAVFLRKNVPRPSEATAWLYMGRLAVDYKGLDLLVKGYASLHQRRNGELPPLVLVGPDFRGGKQQLERLARRLGVIDSVRFKGPVYGEDKQELLAQARLFVHTSRSDTMPFSVFEALALGRPVLVTPETNCTRYVEEYEAGWIVTGTPEAISEGLQEVLEASPQQLDAAGDQARHLVRNNFEWSSLIQQMAELYREVVR